MRIFITASTAVFSCAAGLHSVLRKILLNIILLPCLRSARGHLCLDIVKVLFGKEKLCGKMLYKTEYSARRFLGPLSEVLSVYSIYT
jgi:hypothetical protein